LQGINEGRLHSHSYGPKNHYVQINKVVEFYQIMIRRIGGFLFKQFFSLLFVLKSNLNRGKSLYIMDIDNTLANTFPTLNQHYSSESERLSQIKTFKRMEALVKDLEKSRTRKLIFVTARSYKTWLITYKWLRNNNIYVHLTDVIMVSSPAQKVELLKKITPAAKPVFFVDDMSFNHEYGPVRFYDEQLAEISKLPVKYIGYKTILKFNSKDPAK
jgi:hypothetical protein